MIFTTSFEDTIHFFILLDNNICRKLYDLLGVFKNIILFELHIYANLEQDENLTLYFEDKENGAPKGLNNLPIVPSS